MRKVTFVILIIFMGLNFENYSLAEAGHDEDGHGEEHEESSFGEGKAILDVKKDGKKFRLASNVIKLLKIKSFKISSLENNVFEISSSSIVEFQDETAVYKRTYDWFELVEVKVLERTNSNVKISTKELFNNDEIVNGGVALLRVAHLQASGQGGNND